MRGSPRAIAKLRAIDVWQRDWDPYLQDLEIGFKKFLEWWERFEENPEIATNNYIPPCILCLKEKACGGALFYRETMLNGEEKLVCDEIKQRALFT